MIEGLSPGQCNRPPKMTVALDVCTIQLLAQEINMQQEITANGVTTLRLCKDGIPVVFQVCKLSDSQIEYRPSNGDSVITGSIVDVFNAGYTVECEKPCPIPVSFDLKGGKYFKADILLIANSASGKTFTEWYGWELLVEKIGGKSFDDTAATECYVKSQGDHGIKQLDGAGAKWTVKSDSPLGEQCFEVAAGTIIEFNGLFI